MNSNEYKEIVFNKTNKIKISNQTKTQYKQNSILNNKDKLICFQCSKPSNVNYINNHSKDIVCGKCLTLDTIVPM